MSYKGRLKIFEVEESEFVAGFSKHADINFKKIFVYDPVMTGYPVRLVPSSPVMTGTGAYLLLHLCIESQSFGNLFQSLEIHWISGRLIRSSTINSRFILLSFIRTIRGKYTQIIVVI